MYLASFAYFAEKIFCFRQKNATQAAKYANQVIPICSSVITLGHWQKTTRIKVNRLVLMFLLQVLCIFLGKYFQLVFIKRHRHLLAVFLVEHQLNRDIAFIVIEFDLF